MVFGIFHWLDDRTGYRHLVREVLYERIPGGARWRYVWGSTLAFAFFVQLITGIVLWMYYSASTQTAWESVYYIEFELSGGSFLRGIHHYMAQAMIVLMVLHLMQVVIDGAYRAPREINFWLGLALMLVVFGLGLTGYLLPWDQKGYWATQVATKILGITPLVGEELKTLVVGGNQYGHYTLTRFFALHAGVLPGALIALLVLHLAMFRKHGVTAKVPITGRDSDFWPDQVLKDGVASLAVLIAVCLLAALYRAELGAPADPAIAYNAARPEWYYLFLFQFLKFFHGETGEVLGAVVFPGLAFGVLCLMPIIGRWDLGHRFNVAYLLAIVLGAAGLTAAALHEDYNGTTEKSLQHIEAVEVAHAEAERAHELAARGIPPTGALAQLRDDPKVAGYRLFVRHCAACHPHYDTTGADTDPLWTVHVDTPAASNLYGYGRRAWIEGLLDAERITSEHYFGNTPLADGEMVGWVTDNLGEVRAEMDETERAELDEKIRLVALALEAEAGFADREISQDEVDRGRELIVDEFACIDCHKLGDEGYLGMAPDLTGYASRQWLIDLISNPSAERFYYEENYDAEGMMPAFAMHPDNPALNLLSARELELLANWLRGDWP